MSQIELNSAHEYSVDGRRYPGVTSILKNAGLINLEFIPPSRLEYARDRGTAIHRACHYAAEDDLDETTVDPEIVPAVKAYMAMRIQFHFVCDAVETPFFSERFKYCGKPDMRGHIDGWQAIVDLKSGIVAPWVAIQLAAYTDGQPMRRFSVQLKSDGRFKIHEYPLVECLADFNVFLAALTIQNWKDAHR